MRFNSKWMSFLMLLALVISAFNVPSPARAAAALKVTDQAAQRGYIAVDSITADKPGYVAALTASNKVLGSAAIKAGDNGRVRFKIDLNALEGPDVNVNLLESDSPTFDPAAKVVASQKIKLVAILSTEVQKKASEVSEVTIPLVVAAEDGFVVIHPHYADKGMPYSFGATPVKAGINKNVTVKIANPGRLLTYEVSAALHIDKGTAGQFEFPGPDLPAILGTTVADEPVGIGEQFITAADANVVASKTLVVPTAAASADSFLVLRTGGKDSKFLGFAAIKAGINHDVTLNLTLDAAVPRDAYLQILPKEGDQPTMPKESDGTIVAPDLEPDTTRVIINESVLSYEMDIEAAKAIGGIIVRRVVVNQPTWLRIWDSSSSTQDDVATALIGAGINLNVFVPIPAAVFNEPKDLIVQLHVDLGQPGVWEFPGPDVQLKDVTGLVVRSPQVLVSTK